MSQLIPKMRRLIAWLPIVLLGLATIPACQVNEDSVAEEPSSTNQVDSPSINLEKSTAKVGRAASEDWFRPEAKVRELIRQLEDHQVSERWIYHDLDAAREQARKTGRPLLVVFRCVPCGSAAGLDGAICTAGGAEASKFEAQIRAAGEKLDALLDQFVAVRIVKMNGVNRNVFKFDRDVPYIAMFLNADGTVYGRYGTRASKDRKNLHRQNLPSFQESLRRALDLHQKYPQNQAELAGKRGPIQTPAMTADMEEFVPFPEKYNHVVKNCIHCHTVGEAELRERMAEGPLELRDVWPYPLPDSIGLKIDLKDGVTVESVLSGSAADKAGIQNGDMLLRLASQPITSEADIQWVLHHAPDQGDLPITVRRGERLEKATLALEGDWRKSRTHWRATMSVLRPDVIFDPHPKGLRAYYPRGKAAKVGIRGGDLVVAVDGQNMRLEADLLKYIHIDRPKAQAVELTIVRNGGKRKVTLPIR